MTDHRTLKVLVRERMARTGETYTTAHRNVTAHRRVAAGGAGEHAARADEEAGAGGPHRPSRLARILLSDVGIDVSEPMACGLGGGIGFLYAVFDYAEVQHPLLTIVAQHHPQPWVDAVAEHLGIGLTVATSSSPARARTKLDAVLEAGRPAHLTVGRGLLPWYDDAAPHEAADPYPLVVTGPDGVAGYVVDDGGPEPRTIDAEDLLSSWAAHRKGRFAIATLDVPAASPDLPAAVRAALATTHSHLTGPVLGNAFDVNMGLSGIARLAEDLADTRTRRGWTRRFSTPEAVAGALERLAECLTSAYTAPGATRPLYSAFLTEAQGMSGLSLSDAARTAAQAGELWTRMADLAGAPAAGADPTPRLAAVAEVAAQVVTVEERLAGDLGAALVT